MTLYRANIPGVVALLLAIAVGAPRAWATSYEERSWPARAGLTTAAVIMNVVPLTAVFVAPKCLPGYFLCKVAFAGISVVAAAEHVFFAGGKDDAQTQAILYRGFAGDWVVTGRHVAGDATPDPLPDPPTAPAAP